MTLVLPANHLISVRLPLVRGRLRPPHSKILRDSRSGGMKNAPLYGHSIFWDFSSPPTHTPPTRCQPRGTPTTDPPDTMVKLRAGVRKMSLSFWKIYKSKTGFPIVFLAETSETSKNIIFHNPAAILLRVVELIVVFGVASPTRSVQTSR